MIAIISDIHGNLEALQAVLADIKRHRATEIICLGDLVGYGPDPVPCVELAMEWSVCLRGNHEMFVLSRNELHTDQWMIPPSWAEMIIQFCRDVLKQQKMQSIYPFLESLPRSVQRPEALYVHGTPREPTHEYVFPEDIYNEKKMEAIWSKFSGLCFCGHTHLPGVYSRNSQWSYVAEGEVNQVTIGAPTQLLVNVGSVGQPRDNDPRASYVLFDGQTIRYRRIEYDVQLTMKKLRKLYPPDMHFMAERLAEGR
jgi:predicted phosphodiesterase